MMIHDVTYRDFKLLNHDGTMLADSVSQDNADKLITALNKKACLWKYNQSSFFYDTACGHAFQFVDGDAKANGVAWLIRKRHARMLRSLMITTNAVC